MKLSPINLKVKSASIQNKPAFTGEKITTVEGFNKLKLGQYVNICNSEISSQVKTGPIVGLRIRKFSDVTICGVRIAHRLPNGTFQFVKMFGALGNLIFDPKTGKMTSKDIIELGPKLLTYLKK